MPHFTMPRTRGRKLLAVLASVTILASPLLVATTAQAVTACTTVVSVPVKVLLQGPYSSGTGLMADSLLTRSFLPALEPYAALGYPMRGGETNTTSLVDPVSNASPVDWVLIELRSSTDPTQIVATDTVTIGRDGNAITAPSFLVPAGNYYVAIEHRNHLGLMTAVPVAVSTTTTAVDFSAPTLAVYDLGNNVNGNRHVSGAVDLMVTGEATHSAPAPRQVDYTADHAALLARLGGDTTAIVSGYYVEDFNMDGTVRYSSAGNDNTVLLNGVLGGDQSKVLPEQLPVGVLSAVALSCDPPVITSANPSGIIAGQPFSFTATALGNGPVTFSISSGALPAGLLLNSATGVISGIPTTEGSYTFTVLATNAYGTDSQLTTLSVAAASAVYLPVVSG